MRAAILRSGILLALAALGTSAATAQTELFFATGVDSTGWAQAQSNADGHVLIESLEYPRGLWLHLVDEAGDALAAIQVEYQGRPDSLVAIRCVDPAGDVRETLVWTRPEGDPLRLALKSRETADLPAGLTPIDWQINLPNESLLEPEEETQRIGWEAVAAFLQERWQGQTGRVVVQIRSSAPVTNVAVERSRGIETLVEHLQQTYRPAGTSLEENIALYVQVFRVGLASLQEGVILYPPLFADVNLERVVREVLGRPQGPLASEDVASWTKLFAKEKDIHRLAGIEYLTALRWLDLDDNRIVDITPLNQLTNLTELELRYNQIVDITPLNQLTNLKRLTLRYNQIVDITPLNQLTNLYWLELPGNQIVDITPLNQLTNLKRLELNDNQIVDMTPLNQLTNLGWLTLSYNEMVDVTLLNQLTNLEWLELGFNQIVDITPLNQLTNLKRLELRYNPIVDITPLNQLTNLYWLTLSYNQIVDITPLNQLTNLEWLWLDDNQIVDITPLNQLTNLKRLWLDNNQIEDVSPLVANTGLGEGDEVHLTDNPLNTQALTEQIPVLKARGVKVHF